MTMYADQGRARPDVAPVAVQAPPSRLSITRRPLVDLPQAVPFQAPAANPAPSTNAAPMGTTDAMRLADADVDTGSAFDVPAFLRRQEG
jgi:hypothetical protein